jgi:protein-disulfide isomerase
VPVASIGAAAILLVGGIIVLGNVLRGSSDIDIPERTVSVEGRTLGSPDAPVTIVEYSDFQCSFCAVAAETIVPQIERDYITDGRVKLQYHYVAFEGPPSVWAAEASECANEQGKFWEYHDMLFENQGAFSIDSLKRLAEELKLDTQAFDGCIDSHKHENLVTAEREEAFDQGVNSTPTFIIGEQTVRGARPYEEFRIAIEAELSKNP